MFQNRNPVRVFLYHCISEGNRLSSENFGCHFHFILHVMSDKAVFVRGALLCVQRYQGNLTLYHSNNSASRWQRINLHLYAFKLLLTSYLKRDLAKKTITLPL